jgi:hypothetical protein
MMIDDDEDEGSHPRNNVGMLYGKSKEPPLIVLASGLFASPVLVSWKRDPAPTVLPQTSTFKQHISSIQENYGRNADDFDIYLTSVKKEDLKFLFRVYQEGLDWSSSRLCGENRGGATGRKSRN